MYSYMCAKVPFVQANNYRAGGGGGGGGYATSVLYYKSASSPPLVGWMHSTALKVGVVTKVGVAQQKNAAALPG